MRLVEAVGEFPEPILRFVNGTPWVDSTCNDLGCDEDIVSGIEL